ncbi:MAG: hypothetical protein AUI01_02525 [Ktedonobacter sp. 13_2_20CM_2_56_8]|nr:MAG: hypothetical protein AUI01_02525 [Ktedonobacter sp. 13_2_20CM_2_56_8]
MSIIGGVGTPDHDISRWWEVRLEGDIHLGRIAERNVRVAHIHSRVGSIDHNRRAEGRIELFTEPHAYLVGSDRKHSIPCRVRSQQDSMRETDARKEEHQADGKEGGCQQTPPDGDDARLGMHGSDLVFFQTFFSSSFLMHTM